jgi:hypothetical protein
MKVFISHAEEDQDLAEALTSSLMKEGFDVWRPDHDVFPGDNLAEKVAQAIKTSEAMVIVYSPEAERSPSVGYEIQYALGSLRYKNRVVTVVKGKSVEPPWILTRLPLVHISKRDSGEAARQVAELLREVATA